MLLNKKNSQGFVNLLKPFCIVWKNMNLIIQQTHMITMSFSPLNVECEVLISKRMSELCNSVTLN